KPKEESGCSTTPESNENNCCTPQPKGKVACPTCNEKAKGVLGKTVEHLVTDEAKNKLSCFDGFYYCKTPTCEVVYFRNDEILTQEDMSVVVGLKEGVSPATTCYCFDWTKEKIRAQLQETGETNALEDIKAKMEDPGCSCEILNPSSGCCLGDVSKVIRDLKLSLKV
ncbi:MAG TPA: hypothetical protein ENK68_03595, partial [Epsilonproteobacteria bacterium]|nr:hypothetical protein [Campylobacterota bacterium]